ncbi:signal recognition particle, SRP19 subunit [Serendipita vermifera]|nr:signal recognition particle, SRP19 subunit [Serendipita vermifera]
MPPRATIEEEFDDDTELPLPSRALPNTGTRGALLEEIVDDDDDDEDEMDIPMEPTLQAASSRSVTAAKGWSAAGIPPGGKVTTDKSLFKDWMQIYPIYIDAKQPLKRGCRRIAREKSVWWPMSTDIAQAASTLGFNVVHEAQASHPRDWDNPGRVRINWVQDGKRTKPQFKSRKELLETLAQIIQARRPELIPKPEQLNQGDPIDGGSKSTPQASSSSKIPAAPAAPSKHKKRKIKCPKPPQPFPPLPQRVSGMSPALVSGVLIDAVKAGMDAMKQQQAEAQNAAAVAGVGKGKRKVLRVRG